MSKCVIKINSHDSLYIIMSNLVQADVLVNTTNRDLNLSSGAVSIALLKAGGQQLQAECTNKAPINTGDVAVTSPGALPCRYVFHTIIMEREAQLRR